MADAPGTEDRHIVTLRISEGDEELMKAMARIDHLENMLEVATQFIETELKRLPGGESKP